MLTSLLYRSVSARGSGGRGIVVGGGEARGLSTFSRRVDWWTEDCTDCVICSKQVSRDKRALGLTPRHHEIQLGRLIKSSITSSWWQEEIKDVIFSGKRCEGSLAFIFTTVHIVNVTGIWQEKLDVKIKILCSERYCHYYFFQSLLFRLSEKWSTLFCY